MQDTTRELVIQLQRVFSSFPFGAAVADRPMISDDIDVSLGNAVLNFRQLSEVIQSASSRYLKIESDHNELVRDIKTMRKVLGLSV